MTKHYAAHPIADAFPMIDGKEMEELIQDIKEHGLRHPIVLFEDKVLDGRNRAAACEVIGIEPETVAFEGTKEEAIAYVASTNIHRRHLTISQRSSIAAELRAMSDGKVLDVAGTMNVSPQQVVNASKVLDEGVPELHAAIKHGDLTVHAATQALALEPEQQRAFVQADRSERKGLIAQHIERLGGNVTEPIVQQKAPFLTGVDIQAQKDAARLKEMFDRSQGLRVTADASNAAGHGEPLPEREDAMDVTQKAAAVADGHVPTAVELRITPWLEMDPDEMGALLDRFLIDLHTRHGLNQSEIFRFFQDSFQRIQSRTADAEDAKWAARYAK